MLTIRKFKTFVGMEGHGFNAELMAEGKPVAFVIDDANGGCLNWHWYKEGMRGYKAGAPSQAAVEDMLRQTVAYKESKGRFPTLGDSIHLDTAMINIVCEFEQEKQVRRWCRTKVVGRYPDTPKGEYSTWACKPTPENIAKIKEANKGKSLEVINERFM